MNAVKVAVAAVVLLVACAGVHAQSKPAAPPVKTIQLLATEMEIGRLIGQQGAITSIALTPDGKTAVTGSFEGLICNWDVSSGKCLHVLKHHKIHGVELAVTPDGSRCASVAADGQFCVWDLNTGQMIFNYERERTDQSMISVAISADGKRAALGLGIGGVLVFDVAKEKKVAGFEPESRVIEAVALSPDGSRIAVGGRKRVNERFEGGRYFYSVGDGEISIYETATGQQLKTFPDLKRCVMLRYADGGKKLLWGSAGVGCGVIDTGTNEIASQIAAADLMPPKEGPLYDVAMPEDGSFAIVNVGGLVKLSSPDGKTLQMQRLPGLSSGSGTPALSGDGKLLLVAGVGRTILSREAEARTDGCVLVLDLAADVQAIAAKRAGRATRLEGEGGPITQMWLSNDATRIAVCDEKTLRIYDRASRQYLPTPPLQIGPTPASQPARAQVIRPQNSKPMAAKSPPAVSAAKVVPLQLSPDLKYRAEFDARGVRVVAVDDPDKARSWAIDKKKRMPRSILEFSQDGHWLTIRSNTNGRSTSEQTPPMVLLDPTAENSPLIELTAAPLWPGTVVFSADGKRVAIVGGIFDNGRTEYGLQVWDISPLKQLMSLTSKRPLGSPVLLGDRVGALQSDGVITWYDVATSKTVSETRVGEAVTRFVCNDQGTRMLVSDKFGGVRCIDLVTGATLAAAELGDCRSPSVRFTPDGSAFAYSTRGDGSAIVFQIEVPK